MLKMPQYKSCYTFTSRNIKSVPSLVPITDRYNMIRYYTIPYRIQYRTFKIIKNLFKILFIRSKIFSTIPNHTVRNVSNHINQEPIWFSHGKQSRMLDRSKKFWTIQKIILDHSKNHILDRYSTV